MTKLRDLARAIVSVSEGEIERREIVIVGLRREVERLKKELSEARNQNLNIMPARCAHCVYRTVAMRVLAEEEAAKKAGARGSSLKKGV